MIPFIRHYRLNLFIENTKRNTAISAQEFWQLREFYSPGIIQFNRPELLFTSRLISSSEKIILDSANLDDILPKSRSWKVLFKSKNELIAENGGVTYIFFIKPISEMIKANAYYDNADSDAAFLKDKIWFVATEIKR